MSLGISKIELIPEPCPRCGKLGSYFRMDLSAEDFVMNIICQQSIGGGYIYETPCRKCTIELLKIAIEAESE